MPVVQRKEGPDYEGFQRSARLKLDRPSDRVSEPLTNLTSVDLGNPGALVDAGVGGPRGGLTALVQAVGLSAPATSATA